MVLPQRTGYVPPKTAHVVRGGQMKSSDLRMQAATCLAKHEVMGISLWVAAVPRLEDLVSQTTPFIQKFTRLSIRSLAVLNEYEYQLLPTGRAPHYTLVLPSTGEDDLDKLRDCFLIIPNSFHEN